MNVRILLSWVYFFCFFSIAYSQSSSLRLSSKYFDKTKITKGLVWYSNQSGLNGNNQSLNILKVNLKKRQVDLLYTPDTLITTDQYAKSVEAIAAVNAGFFDMKIGGSVTYLKKDGQILAQNKEGLEEKGSVVIEGAIVILKNGSVQISAPKASDWYSSAQHIDDVLLSGPLLISNGESIELKQSSFNDNRHPRTCACTTKSGHLLLLTVDGRNEQALGMSLPELSQVLLQLGCEDALNLDGGGSTTMYIQGQHTNGIVNYPSDNKRFDHFGQRSVSNVISIH